MSTIVRPDIASVTTRTSSRPGLHSPALRWAFLLILWAAVYAGSLFSPPLLDDADATHAEAAQAMLHTGDWVTLHVNGIRYLEKPPLPYWMAATSMKLFGENTFAIHLPLALTVLGLALLGFRWARRAFGETAGFLAAMFTLTAAGVFLFTRIFIPDALLALLLGTALYSFLNALDELNPHATRSAYTLWAALGLAVLTKGLVSLVFFFGTALIFLVLTRTLHTWRRLRPVTGLALMFAIAAPWHILAGLRNTAGANGHGFFWFYFINEHVLRFLGKRIPRDYNKLPGYLYWSLHLVWLFPWSFFAPAAALALWRKRISLRSQNYSERTTLLLTLFAGLVLVFFSISTNQEYYTFPVYLPLLILTAGVLARLHFTTAEHRALTAGFASLTVIGLLVAVALGYGLWSSRNLPFNPDIGSLLAHRGVGDYTLSMSHFFDLTGASFAALRLPASLALLAFAFGPAAAWVLFHRNYIRPALATLGLTTALFLIAAHIALGRFAPMLSSEPLAESAHALETADPSTRTALYGDQAYGSSIPFYLGHRVSLVEGRSTSMLFGSTFPDAPPVFLTGSDYAATWGTGPRKLLFVPLEKRDDVDRLLGHRAILIRELSGKALLTDRPLP